MLSRYDQKAPAVEGFGITFLEAGSCKKPVIAGDSGGVSDAVLHQETGILVDPTDSQKISESIKALLSDSELCKKLGENAHRRIHQELTWDHVGKNVSDSIMRKFSDEA